MHTKNWAKFVWEENVKKLGMPHFFLGKHENSLSKFVHLLLLLFLAFIFLGFGSVMAITVFICEKVCVRNCSANILSLKCKSSKQFNQEQN